MSLLPADEVPTPLKRGRGRPKGSFKRPRAPDLSPEQAEALKRELAASYAEAVAAQTMAGDRKCRIKASIRSTFGKSGLQDVEAMIVAARGKIGFGEREAR